MKEIIFSSFSLILFDGQKIIHSSEASGLKPLFECVKMHKNEHVKYSLYDKVIGLAAAKLVVYSGNITEVKTPLASKLAVDFLKLHKIKIDAEKIVERIMNKDKTDMCPMEKKAMDMQDMDDFISNISIIFNK